MSEMKIHPNSQTALGLQNNRAVPAAANDIKAKMSSEKFYRDLSCAWICRSQHGEIQQRWPAAKILSFAMFVWLNCSKTTKVFLEFWNGTIPDRLYPRAVMNGTGNISQHLLLKSCERYDISQLKEQKSSKYSSHMSWWFPVALLFVSRFRWRRRLVVISAPSDEDWAYSQQLAALSGQACNFGESKEITLLLPKNHILPGDVMDSFAQVWN